MRKIIIVLIPILLVGCINQRSYNSRYSSEQIASLHLDSTKIIEAETGSVITVDLNPFLSRQSFDFGSLVDEVKLIPLETTDESLIDGIYKILVTDSNIYIHDRYKGGGIVIFDREGKFIERISNGQGPGELLRLYDIDFDYENNELVAYQHSFLLFYSSSGQYLRRERLPFGFYNFLVIPGGYIFKTLDRQDNGHLGDLEDHTVLITDKDFKLESVALSYPPSDVNYGGYHYLYNNDNSISITQKFSNTIHQYMHKTNKIEAKYILDYKKKMLPESYLRGTAQGFENAVDQNDYYYYLGKYVGTKSHDVFYLCNNYIGLNTIIYRDNVSGNLKGGTAPDFSFMEIPIIAFPSTSSGDYLVSYYLPHKNDSQLSNSSIISKEDKLKIKDMRDDDNPVLAFFKLKNF